MVPKSRKDDPTVVFDVDDTFVTPVIVGGRAHSYMKLGGINDSHIPIRVLGFLNVDPRILQEYAGKDICYL